MYLKDAVVVITGASDGLGKALAYEFHQHQAKLMLAARHLDKLQQVAGELSALYRPTDVTSQQQVAALAAATLEAYGRIDIWINNAGSWMQKTPFENISGEDLERILNVDFRSVWNGCQAALPIFKQQRSGTIVNVISTAGIEGKAGESAYCAAKHAVSGLTNALVQELKDSPIRVIGAYPGGMKTAFYETAGRPASYEQFMEPSEVAKALVENLLRDQPETALVLRRK